MAGKSYNNNIFKVITELDKRNFDFFKSYNEAQYKELQPYTLLRWLSAVQSGSNDEYYVLKTNELVNDRVFNLSEHKDLALNLLCACGSGGWNKHAWIAISRDARLDKVDTIVKNFYKLNDDEWNLKKDVIDSKEVLNYLGLNDKGK